MGGWGECELQLSTDGEVQVQKQYVDEGRNQATLPPLSNLISLQRSLRSA